MKLPHYITLILWAFGIVNIVEPFNGPYFILHQLFFTYCSLLILLNALCTEKKFLAQQMHPL